ncbi:MAG: helix-turn-helix domain-containing protein [Clostridia bacterium]|nr:helix-turn-helix domain-containing protein [Clostridia bacterium]
MIHDQLFVLDDFAAPQPMPGLFEITYVTGGNGIRLVNGKKQKLVEGNFFLSEPADPPVLSDLKGLSVVRLLFIPSFIDQAYVKCATYKELAHSFLLRFTIEISANFHIETLYIDSDKKILSLINDILWETETITHGHLEMRRCYVLQIILNIFRLCSATYNPFESLIDHNTFFRTYDYCQKNYAKNIKLSDMCKDLHYTLPYLSARFKEVHGCTFTELVQRFRIEEACRLLLSTNKKISEIASSVGYSDAHTFFDIFKKHIGTTPLQYRKVNSHF